MHLSYFVIPIYCDSGVYCAVPLYRDFVIFLEFFVWGVVHVSLPRILLRNSLPLVWIVLVASRVSIVWVIVCFFGSRFCQVAFRGARWLVVRTVVSHTCRSWRQYIPRLLHLFFILVCILLWSRMGCLGRVCGCILGALVVSWGKS